MMDNDSEAVKTVGQDAEKILKLQEKLTSIQNQIHYWTAKSKVFEQRGGCNFDAFVRAPLTPSKRPTKSRSLMARQDWATLNFTQQYEILHNVARDHSRVTLNFEALAMAIKASQSSEALRKALDPESNGDKEEIDPDERKYLFELLEEESELSEAILKAEDEQLDKKLKLLHAKCELANEFSELRNTYSTLLKNVPEEEITPAVPRKRQKSGNKPNQLEQKYEDLKAEEDRLNEMRYLIQKLMMAAPGGCMTYDEETNKRHKSMLVKCGEDLSKLRGDDVK